LIKNGDREWSEEGSREREECFSRIEAEVVSRVGRGGRVLVPGCGLGRLPIEIAKRGFETQGNEFRFYSP